MTKTPSSLLSTFLGEVGFIDSSSQLSLEDMPTMPQPPVYTKPKPNYDVPLEYKAEGVWGATEEEQAFIITDKVSETLDKLYTFTKLGNYKLGTGTPLSIVDTFYDTPEGTIRDGKSSLRVREVNGKPFVTIKGKNQSKDSSKRSEFEVEWPYTIPSPHDVANVFALAPIQRRETARLARPIVRKFDGELIAELAIDTVTYTFEDEQTFKLFEVEIEMKSNKGLPLNQLSLDLMNKIGNLSKWNSSKFSMGKVLEYASQIKIDENGFLTNDAYWALANLKA